MVLAVEEPPPPYVSSAPKVIRKSGPTPAMTLHQMLRPGNLRSQFILMEILQPPLTLREPKDE